MRRRPPTENERHRVVIVGGGFGGLYAARALRRAPVDITLVDRSNHHLDKGRLAVIGRSRAVGTAFGIRFTGLLALLVWAVVHVYYLLGWGNRLVTVTRWVWTLLTRDRAERAMAAS